jgi:hypothetical protein
MCVVSDDIIKRLLNLHFLKDSDLVKLMVDAAKEIRDLREELEKTKRDLQRIEMKYMRATKK